MANLLDIIELINCQSLAHVKFKVAKDKINVIAGANNAGKSVLFKVITVAICANYYSADRLHELIQWDKEYARVNFIFDDGSYGGVIIVPNSATYYYKEDEDTPMRKSHTPFDEVINKLGVIVSGKHRFIPNIIDTVQAKLLVDPKLKQNLEIISLIIHDEKLDSLEEKSKEDKLKYASVKKKVRKSINSEYDRIHGLDYVDIDSLLNSIQVREDLYPAMCAFMDCIDSLGRMRYSKYNEDYDLLLEITKLELPEIRKEIKYDPEWYDLISFAEIKVPDLKESKYSEDYMLMLDFLRLQVPDIKSIEYSEDLPHLVSYLNTITKLRYNIPEVQKPLPDLESMLNVVSILGKGFTTLDKVYDTIELVEERQIELDTLTEELNKFRVVDKCPLYGKVYHENGVCVPCTV